MSRRQWLNTSLRLGCAVALPGVLAACGGKSAALCSDPAQLSDAENSLRASLHYVEHAQRESSCAQCGFFEAPPNAPCGNCTLLKGPVNPAGHCDSWSARG
jgi:hypothetical protein